MASSPNTDLVCLGPVKRGRPSLYTDELAQEICERIANGEELQEICEDDHMPTSRTVNNWLLSREDFNFRYARAREVQMHHEAAEIKILADDCDPDPDYVAKTRLQIEARKWRAERLNRRVYGNSTKHEIDVAVHPAVGAEQIPAGIGWLAQFLPVSEPAARSEPGDSSVGEE